MRQRRPLRIAIGTLTAALTINGILGYMVLTNGQWDPLGEYPLQVVDEIRDDAVIVTGTKCNDSGKPVRVTGTRAWQRLEPPGLALEVATTVRVRPVGCEARTFVNDYPAEVLAGNCDGCVWRQVGTNTPIGELRDEFVDTPFDNLTPEMFKARDGVPRVWQTENFEIPQGAP